MGNCAAGVDVTWVWDIGIRVFHWLAVAAVATASVTGLFGPLNLLDIHLAAGAALGGLVAFRMLWGFMGPTMLIRLLDNAIKFCHCRDHGHSRLPNFAS